MVPTEQQPYLLASMTIHLRHRIVSVSLATLSCCQSHCLLHSRSSPLLHRCTVGHLSSNTHRCRLTSDPICLTSLSLVALLTMPLFDRLFKPNAAPSETHASDALVAKKAKQAAVAKAQGDKKRLARCDTTAAIAARNKASLDHSTAPTAR